MFQYAFLRGYARSVGADIQTPDWWGRKVFPIAAEDPLIDRHLPQTHCDSVTHQLGLPLGYFISKSDIDLQGFFQNQKFLDFYTRQQVRDWFKLTSDCEGYAPDESMGQYNAKHLRRGDYTTSPTFQKLYCTISDKSYERAEIGLKLDTVIRVFDGGSLPEFEELKAIGIEWLPDFLVLRDAAILLRSNSTFSWWAATLGHGTVYAPLVGNKVGLQDVEFIEGNWPNTAGVFPNQSDLHLKEWQPVLL